MNATTNMNQAAKGNEQPRERRSYTWLFEILVAVTVAPALIHAVASLNDLPIV